MEVWNEFWMYGWTKLVVPLITLGITWGVGVITKRALFRSLKQWAAKTKTDADDIFIQAMSGPFLIWVLMLGLYIAMQTSPMPEWISSFLGKGLLFLWVLSLTVVASRLVANLIKYYGNQIQGTLPVTSLTQNLARLAVVTIGLLILLNFLGISITPILTALGVGGLAVALALQDTLSNLFAGFYVSLAGQVRIGDYIKLESSEEGYVTDISLA
jgi:small-conductance mechanosensitive channel